jgi:hypothetical protein
MEPVPAKVSPFPSLVAARIKLANPPPGWSIDSIGDDDRSALSDVICPAMRSTYFW